MNLAEKLFDYIDLQISYKINCYCYLCSFYYTGIPRVSAKSIVEETWEDCDLNNPRTIKELYNIKNIFYQLHREGIKIAICTSDNRKATERTLKTLDLLSYVDVLKCADDGSDHGNVQDICEELGIKAEDTAVVGDTVADVRMGFNAGNVTMFKYRPPFA